MALSNEQIERYSRQIIVPGIGGRGQERLIGSRALIVGTDTVVRTAALYLAGAGVGRLDVGGSTPALAEELFDLNPEVRIDTVGIDTDALAADYAVAVVAARPVESVCRIARGRVRHLVTAGTAQRCGWLTITAAGEGATPCPACVSLAYPSIATRSALQPPIASIIGSLAALEALKILLGLGAEAHGQWLHYDGEDSTLEERTAAASPQCPLCHDREHRRS
jgi:adenylyltransferase/sulfurtransferase